MGIYSEELLEFRMFSSPGMHPEELSEFLKESKL